jgi:hypothetical protein
VEETPAEPEKEEAPPEPEAEEEVKPATTEATLLDHLKQETLKEQADLEMDKLNANITIAKNEGRDPGDLEKVLEEMKQEVANGNYNRAVEIGVKANEEAKPDPSAPSKGDVENTVKRLQMFIDKAPTILDVTEAQELLNKASEVLATGDTTAALKHAKACKVNLKEKGDQVNKIKANLKGASVNITKSKAAGKDTEVAEDLMRKAKAALKAKDYNQALRHSEDCLAKSES